MSAHLEILLPGPRNTRIPLRDAILRDSWQHNEGHVLWTVNGTPLLTGDFDLYPVDQIAAVLDVLDHVLAKRRGVVSVPGSIILLGIEPASGALVTLTRSVHRRHNPEVVEAHVRVRAIEVCLVTLSALRRELSAPNLLRPSPRPSAGLPREHALPEIMEHLASAEAACKGREVRPPYVRRFEPDGRSVT
jgi:hypothetical protein